MENVLIFGATGAGKSSGSGRAIALALLQNTGAGGLVLCAKDEEVSLWERYCAESTRTEDLRVIRPGGPWRFNPVSYELARSACGLGLSENVVGLFETILELSDRNGGTSGSRDEEAYWRRATKQLVRNFVELSILATDTVSIDLLYRAVISAPQTMDDVRSQQFRDSSYCFRLLQEADKRSKSQTQAQDFALVADYILLELPNLSQKTRSVIISCFTSQIDVMQRSVLRELFGSDTTLTPRDCEDGAIIVVGLPTKTFRETGVLANVITKYCWQRSIESRDVTRSARPVFLWCDEFQTFVTSHDAQFLATCRSARAGTILLTQNVPGVYAALGGGDKGRAEADAIFANCNLKVFHSNSDPQTNQWASTLIGRTRQFMANGNNSYAADDMLGMGAPLAMTGGTSTAGFSEVYEFEVQPSTFSTLRTGGPANGWCVDAIVFQNGRVFTASGRNWLPVTFRQKCG